MAFDVHLVRALIRADDKGGKTPITHSFLGVHGMSNFDPGPISDAVKETTRAFCFGVVMNV
jgi:hypothetical protein